MAIYEWATNNVENQSGAAIQWRHENQTREEAILQVPEFAAIAETIQRTSETVETRIVTIGTLIGADLHTHSFRFLPDGEDTTIRGRFSDAISETQKAQLPQRYTATIVKTAITSYATEQDKASYFLELLADAPPPPENLSIV
jgi:hypothetical protein